MSTRMSHADRVTPLTAPSLGFERSPVESQWREEAYQASYSCTGGVVTLQTRIRHSPASRSAAVIASCTCLVTLTPWFARSKSAIASWTARAHASSVQAHIRSRSAAA